MKDKEKRQNKLESEVRSKRSLLENLGNENVELRDRLEEKAVDDERGLISIREEKEYLNSAIIQLAADLDEKSKELVDAENQTTSLIEKKDRYLKESSQVIDDLKKEMRMVREGYDSKEQEVSMLT